MTKFPINIQTTRGCAAICNRELEQFKGHKENRLLLMASYLGAPVMALGSSTLYVQVEPHPDYTYEVEEDMASLITTIRWKLRTSEKTITEPKACD